MSYTISLSTLSILRCRYGVGVCVCVCVWRERRQKVTFYWGQFQQVYLYTKWLVECLFAPFYRATTRVHTLPKNISSITILLSGPRHNWKCPNVNAIKIFDITQNVR